MCLSLLSFDLPWLDIMSLVVAITFLEGAVTGRGTTRGRHWPVAGWLRPVFAIVGIVALAFGLTDLLLRFSK
jgi:hypothetical protein